jgi:hypothetical protein
MFDFVELLVLGAIVWVLIYIITFASPLIPRWRYPNLRGYGGGAGSTPWRRARSR